MSDINFLVYEDFARPDGSFYDSRGDENRKINGKTDIDSIQKFLSGKSNLQNSDEIKSNKASTITGMSAGITHPMQKMTSNFGGIDKFLNKPDIDVNEKLASAQKMKNVAVKNFNRIMGEKVL